MFRVGIGVIPWAVLLRPELSAVIAMLASSGASMNSRGNKRNSLLTLKSERTEIDVLADERSRAVVW